MRTNRRHYLVTYDISDDKRRNAVFETLMDNGNHAQYSVFFCELTPMELATLRHKLVSWINHREDQILILDLGTAARPLESGLDCLGRSYEPPARVMVV